MIGNIQEETHRFAIEYQRSLRNESFGSELEKIEGIGDKKSKALLKHFKTISAIKSADVDELCKVEGINRPTAQKIYDYFRKNIDNEQSKM